MKTAKEGSRSAQNSIINCPSGVGAVCLLFVDTAWRGLSGAIINADDTETVQLMGKRGMRFRDTILHVRNAQNVNIECDFGKLNCKDMKIYMVRVYGCTCTYRHVTYCSNTCTFRFIINWNIHYQD